MTKEELKKEAEEKANKVIIGSGMDRASVIHLKHLLVTMYMQGATETTKELEAQIEKMKCCPTCDNNKEEHTPEEHYRCKTCRKFCNWELAD